MAFQFTNWGRNQRCTAQALHRPRSEAELAVLVAEISASGGAIRVVGAGHSWSDAVLTDQHLISLDLLNRVVAIDTARKEVTVQAGIRIHTLMAALRSSGLGLINVGSVAEQSIGGATATGTHGTGVCLGNLSSHIRKLRLLTAGGEWLTLSPSEDPELFSAGCINLGALGIVTEMTLAVRDHYRLEENASPHQFETLLSTLPERLEQNRHVKLWWLPHTGTIQCFAYNETRRSSTPRRLRRSVDESALMNGLFNGLLFAGRVFPGAVPSLNGLVSRGHFRKTHRVAPYEQILNIPMPPRHDEMEYAIPAVAACEVLRSIRRMIARCRLSVNFVAEVRWVARDDIMLSPANGRDVCHITACMAKSRDLEKYYTELEAIFRDADGRPHWGKVFTVEDAAMQRAYPSLGKFSEIRRKLDPEGVFLNAYVRRVLALPSR